MRRKCSRQNVSYSVLLPCVRLVASRNGLALHTILSFWANSLDVKIKILCPSFSNKIVNLWWFNPVTACCWCNVEFQRVFTLAGMPFFLPNSFSKLSLTLFTDANSFSGNCSEVSGSSTSSAVSAVSNASSIKAAAVALLSNFGKHTVNIFSY